MESPTLACFISPHGFGHAAREAAILAAFHALNPSVRVEIFTRVPRWFFEQSLAFDFGYHEVWTDVGLVQTNSLDEDIPATLAALERFTHPAPALTAELAARLRALRCQAVLCDISALGVLAARAAQIPSILIENFTWDWIYQPYATQNPAFIPFIEFFQEIYASVQYHVQTSPACAPSLNAALVTPPVSRGPRLSRAEIRAQLGLSPAENVVLVTMGGIREQHGFLSALQAVSNASFIIPGSVEEETRSANLCLIPHHSRYFHPDLVQACDLVIGKVGYSTLAETYRAGLPYGFITRDVFPESPILAHFALSEMNGAEIHRERFASGEWIHSDLPALLQTKKYIPTQPNGAGVFAEWLTAELFQ